MKQVTLRFKGHDVKMETKGFTGKQCMADTLDVKRALGQVVTERPTSEMATATAVETQRTTN